MSGKMSDLDMMSVKIGKSGHDDGKDNKIRARCRRTPHKMKGSNLGTLPENPKQNEGNESGNDAGEPKTKGRD